MNHLCRAAKLDCYNPYDSYGEICVRCNCCGCIDKKTMYQCRIETDKRHLVETAAQLIDENYQTDLQQKNILSSIETFIKQIRKSQKHIKESEDEE